MEINVAAELEPIFKEKYVLILTSPSWEQQQFFMVGDGILS